MRHPAANAIPLAAAAALSILAWEHARRASFGRWVPAGQMHHARRGHASVRLADGRVLVVGGDSAAPRSAEIWDPITNAWSLTGSTSAAHGEHLTATLLLDGRVLVAGGAGTESATRALDAVELWDPETGRFTRASPMLEPRQRHSAVVLDDGRVLIAGGLSSRVFRLDPKNRKSSELFDPATGAWTRSGDLSSGRREHTAVRLRDGRVAIAGGVAPSRPKIAVEIWEPKTGVWTRDANAPEVFAGTSAHATPDGRLLLLTWAPRSFDRPPAEALAVYDAVEGRVERLDPIAAGRDHASIAHLLSGEVLLAGGAYDVKEEPDVFEQMEAEEVPAVVSARVIDETSILLPGTPRWRTASSLADARARHAATPLLDGGALISGGTGERGTLRSAERWVPRS